MDRFAAALCAAASLHDVLAFPKTAQGHDLCVGAPSEAAPAALLERGLVAAGQAEALADALADAADAAPAEAKPKLSVFDLQEMTRDKSPIRESSRPKPGAESEHRICRTKGCFNPAIAVGNYGFCATCREPDKKTREHIQDLEKQIELLQEQVVKQAEQQQQQALAAKEGGGVDGDPVAPHPDYDVGQLAEATATFTGHACKKCDAPAIAGNYGCCACCRPWVPKG